MMTHYQNLLIEDRTTTRIITVNRPDKLNALNKETLAELRVALTEAFDEDSVRAILLTGAGPKAFVAGADIAEFSDFSPNEGRELALGGQADVFDQIHHAPKPVIAAINGFALGGGLELALACHVRVSASSAKMGLPEVSLGLIPGYGGTQRLTQLVGRGRAMEMILTGDMISAHEAEKSGMVNHVVEPEVLLEKSLELASKMATRSRTALTAAIQAINASLDPQANGYETEIELFASLFGTDDFIEGVAAFLEKRKPNF